MTQNSTNQGPKIALFEPDIPQNTASIIRTCSCLGAKLEIIEPCGFLMSDKRFKRVVMDYMDEKEIKFYESMVPGATYDNITKQMIKDPDGNPVSALSKVINGNPPFTTTEQDSTFSPAMINTED